MALRQACSILLDHHSARYIHHIFPLLLCGLFGTGAWLQYQSGRDLMPMSLVGLRLFILVAFTRLLLSLSAAPPIANTKKRKRDRRRIRWLLWTCIFTFFSSVVVLALSAADLMPVPTTLQCLLSVLTVGSKHIRWAFSRTSDYEGDTESITTAIIAGKPADSEGDARDVASSQESLRQ